MLGQHIPKLHEFVDVASIHVNIPYPSIFLCGGDISSTTPDNKPKSLRGAFLRFAYDSPFDTHRILVAEELNAFFPRGTYKDLLSLESDLAQIASLILVFSESYGSAAELGAFAMKEEIAERLLIVIDDKNYEDSSFVKLGPLRSLQNNVARSSVYVFDRAEFNIPSIENVGEIDITAFRRAMIEAITNREQSIQTTSTFNPMSHGHQIMLMVGIIQLHGALTLVEIETVTRSLGVNLLPENIENLLLCAEFIGWVSKIARGSFDYYVSTVSKQAISFRRQESNRAVDPIRWRADVLGFWKITDATRFGVISSARASR